MEEPKRQIAMKVQIRDVVEGEYRKQDGWSPNYIIINNKQISRANIIATIISKNQEFNRFTIDDGTGQLLLRSFENINLDGLNIGDIILLIGRPREYNNEKYIIPEIIKKIEDNKWIEIRKKEIEIENLKNNTNIPEEVKEEVKVEEEVKEEKTNSYEDIINIIKELDKGDGADFESVIEKAKQEDTEEILNKLIEEGELFELKPGKLKILE